MNRMALKPILDDTYDTIYTCITELINKLLSFFFCKLNEHKYSIWFEAIRTYSTFIHDFLSFPSAMDGVIRSLFRFHLMYWKKIRLKMISFFFFFCFIFFFFSSVRHFIYLTLSCVNVHRQPIDIETGSATKTTCCCCCFN